MQSNVEVTLYIRSISLYQLYIMVDLVVFLPRSAAAFQQVQRRLLSQREQQEQQKRKEPRKSDQNSSTTQNATTSTTFLCFNAHASRCLWREFKPCCMDAQTPPETVAKLGTCLFSRPTNNSSTKRCKKASSSQVATSSLSFVVIYSPPSLSLKLSKFAADYFDDPSWQSLVEVQTWQNLPRLSSTNPSPIPNNQNHIFYTWLLPPLLTCLEYAWEQRLIHWEHTLIQAQSLAGWYSTLGGGYFMTHHASTAILLAYQQQRAAAILGDTTMMLKCTINMAYDCIACGYFRPARTLMRQVERILDKNDIHKDAVVLRNMCRAAHLFSRRVQQWARKQQDNAHQGKHKGLRDDFYRIRIVTDRSSVHDIPQSFRSAMTTTMKT